MYCTLLYCSYSNSEEIQLLIKYLKLYVVNRIYHEKQFKSEVINRAQFKSNFDKNFEFISGAIRCLQINFVKTKFFCNLILILCKLIWICRVVDRKVGSMFWARVGFGFIFPGSTLA